MKKIISYILIFVILISGIFFCNSTEVQAKATVDNFDLDVYSAKVRSMSKKRKVKNPAQVSLSLNTTYTDYDVNGDGERDTIRISSISSDSIWDVGLEIQINGKKVFSDKQCYYAGIEAYLCTLKNGKVYLYFYNPCDDGDSDYCGLYQYNKGKFKCVLDMNKFYGSDKLGYHTHGSVKTVSGNEITVSVYQQNYELGGIEVCFDYKYSKGKLVQAANSTRKFDCWAATRNNGKLTTRSNIKVYANTNCKTKAFLLKPGEQIKIKSIYCKSGKMLLKVQRLSDGKNGYIKCIKHYPKDRHAPFAEVEYAG